MKKDIIIVILIVILISIFAGVLSYVNRNNFRREVLQYCHDDPEICMCIADEAYLNNVDLQDFRIFVKHLSREGALLRLFLIQDETAITMMRATIKCGGTL